MIVGVCKDAHNVVEQTFHRLSQIEFLQNATWLVVESNSSQSSKRALREFAEPLKNLSILFLEDSDERENRVSRIANARNAYVKEIKRRKPDKVVVIDFDSKLLSRVQIPESMFFKNERDISVATQVLCYFDIFALRFPRPQRVHILRKHSSWLGKLLDWVFITIPYQLYVTLRSKRPYTVHSAFGGLGIYPGKVFERAHYGKTPSFDEECEHITFNQIAREMGYRITIQPQLVYGLANEHCFFISPLVFFSDVLRRWIRSMF